MKVGESVWKRLSLILDQDILTVNFQLFTLVATKKTVYRGVSYKMRDVGFSGEILHTQTAQLIEKEL
jgi:hypothetical protein